MEINYDGDIELRKQFMKDDIIGKVDNIQDNLK